MRRAPTAALAALLMLRCAARATRNQREGGAGDHETAPTCATGQEAAGMSPNGIGHADDMMVLWYFSYY